MYVVSARQMKEAESNAVKRGTTYRSLMEKAGTESGRIIRKKCRISSGSALNILILCGKGKNGGDGFVIARYLSEKGSRVTVLLTSGDPAAEDAVHMYELMDKNKIDVIQYNGVAESVVSLIDKNDIIIDCMFGTGFEGKLPHNLSSLVSYVNESGKYIVSIDIPSGTICDSAKVNGTAVKANLTIAIAAFKPIHVMKPYSEYCGEVVAADIGIEECDYQALGNLVCFTCDDKEISSFFPKRKTVSNKGTYGHSLCICGSKKMQGACVLSVNSALRSGCGLVTAAFPECIYPAVTAKVTEALTVPLSDCASGTLSRNALTDLIELSDKATAILIGCGLGINTNTRDLVYDFLKLNTKPIIIDADGLNIISQNLNILKSVKSPVVITPHPGEMSRLTGLSVNEIISDPIRCAVDFALEYNVIVVLKGANTVICCPDPFNVYINKTGNSGLSKGGSGDFLSGMMVSFTSQGMNVFESAVSAVYLHGKCADITSEKLSQRGMLPSDMLNVLPELLSDFE